MKIKEMLRNIVRKITFVFLCFLFFQGINGQDKLNFVFGTSSNEPGIISVLIPENYTDSTGFGFDFENKEKVGMVQETKGDKWHPGYCTSDVSFYFSVKVPEGVYDITVAMGHPELEGVTTVKAEARRLMIFNQKIFPGRTTYQHFAVSVRTPQIDSVRSIRLKPREVSYMNWDNRLTLEFSGKNIAIQAITIKPKNEYKTLFLAGNSTVTDQDCSPWASWGQMITCYFGKSLVVANYAESGESLLSFKQRGRLDKILSLMKPGDYLFIEFGHNDQKQTGEGAGAWNSFTVLLHEYLTRTREKGGIPVLLTPVQRRSFNEQGKIEDTHDDYPEAIRKAASELSVPLIDLTEMTRTLYENWSEGESKKAFVHYPAGTFSGQEKPLEDNTHFNDFGAHEIACCVLKGILDLNLGIARDITGFDVNYHPGNPNRFENWTLPVSPRWAND